MPCEKLFLNPTAEYRGAPFWAWNCKLEGEELARQIDVFKEMGLGGFFMHSRSGLATEYMGEDFLEMAALCNRKAVENEMICYLYDEDRWPSGAAGGLVTKSRAYRMQMLVVCPAEDAFGQTGKLPYRRNQNDQAAARALLARYRVRLDDGDLLSYERVGKDDPADYEAYLAIAGNDPWFNNEAYLNTLDKKAVAKFIESTHEKYKVKLGESFGKSIPAIFTDEPQFAFKGNLSRGADAQTVVLPYTADFEETYAQAYGEGFLDFLPELFWEWRDGRVSLARYRYHDHVCERFTEAFSDQIGAWCRENGLMLTGHMMEEHSLYAQTRAIGDCMRAYRGFQLPGIDMLCDRREYITAKQAQSAAHQYGRAGVLSELYGVTNWDFDFRGHKLQGDWQAALGVTLRVHHLSWVSMAGEAKRDYPASISYQSPWYKEYSFVEDHFARVNTALTQGTPVVRVAVIHPVESMWTAYGPNDKTADKRGELDAQLKSIAEWLLFGQMDFDFISESLLQDLYKETTDGKLAVGQMTYDAVVVPPCLTIRASTRDALEVFAASGGWVVYMSGTPKVIDGRDGLLEGETAALAEGAVVIPFAKTVLLNALEPFREVRIIREDGVNAERWIYQLRKDGEDFWLFVCNGTKPENEDLPHAEAVVLAVNGEFAPELWDTMTGTVMPQHAEYKNGKTLIRKTLHMHDSLLFKLKPRTEGSAFNTPTAEGAVLNPPTVEKATPNPPTAEKVAPNPPISEEKIPDDSDLEWNDLPAPYGFTADEHNVLVLDTAAYAFDDGEWQATERGEDVLRIDNLFRAKLGYPLRRNAKAQPWTLGAQPEAEHLLSLRFTVKSETALNEIHLALENPENTHIIWRGEDIDPIPTGYYADRSIKTIALPGLAVGDNVLTLLIPFDKATDVENCFLLGWFGVRLQGRTATLTDYPAVLPFGDITRMGFPFYGGNMVWHCRLQGEGKRIRLQAPHFRNPLLSVDVNGTRAGVIAYAPYTVDLDILPPGRNDMDITAYGNRVNTFGALHNANKAETWFGPDAWRTTGNAWSYEYRVKPTGILVSPRIAVLPNTPD
ncbi:MAG: hypothetical protein FWD90_04495 [Defluviitaleaceae bacterium]|nr:hypothetical protein [Defluviitaleaceae bacterium]